MSKRPADTVVRCKERCDCLTRVCWKGRPGVWGSVVVSVLGDEGGDGGVSDDAVGNDEDDGYDDSGAGDDHGNDDDDDDDKVIVVMMMIRWSW